MFKGQQCTFSTCPNKKMNQILLIKAEINVLHFIHVEKQGILNRGYDFWKIASPSVTYHETFFFKFAEKRENVSFLFYTKVHSQKHIRK